MLKKTRRFLKCFIFVELGWLFGNSLADYIHYSRNTELYETMSAPWHTNILINALLTATVLLLTAVAYFIIGWVIKKKAKDTTEVKN